MSVAVAVNTYTHSVTYVTDNILRSLQDIVRLSGLSPGKIATDWETLQRGISTWIRSQHLEKIILEAFNPKTNESVGRWDIEITYGWTGDDGRFWVDTDQIRMAILKAGVWPADSDYRIVCSNKEGREEVVGWSSTTLRSTAGMVQQSLGTTIEHNGLGASASYYRKVG